MDSHMSGWRRKLLLELRGPRTRQLEGTLFNSFAAVATMPSMTPFTSFAFKPVISVTAIGCALQRPHFIIGTKQ